MCYVQSLAYLFTMLGNHSIPSIPPSSLSCLLHTHTRKPLLLFIPIPIPAIVSTLFSLGSCFVFLLLSVNFPIFPTGKKDFKNSLGWTCPTVSQCCRVQSHLTNATRLISVSTRKISWRSIMDMIPLGVRSIASGETNRIGEKGRTKIGGGIYQNIKVTSILLFSKKE